MKNIIRGSIFIVFFIVLMFAVTSWTLADDVIKDDFEKAVLDRAWSWSANPEITYSLTNQKGFLSVDIPGGRPYDIWSDDVRDGMLLLRNDQGNADWIIETGFEVQCQGQGCEVGLVIWSNPYIMYFWTAHRDSNKNNWRPLGQQLGISNLDPGKNAQDLGNQIVLRVEKLGKKLLLQYWDETEQNFITYRTFLFKFPVNGVGLMARTFKPESGAEVHVLFDYFKLLK